MASTFSKLDIGSTWSLLIDGATYQRFGVQIISTAPVRLAIAASGPGAGTEDYITLAGGFSPEFSEELLAADKVYVRTEGGTGVGAVRGFRVPR